MVQKEEFNELAEIHSPHCVSIYLPNNTEEEDRITLKNSVTEARKILLEVYHLDQEQASSLVAPLMKYPEKFNHQSPPHTGTVLFLAGGDTIIRTFHGVDFSSQVYVSDHLYLLPLAPLVGENQGALILSLSAKSAKLYEQVGETLVEHPVSAKLPSSMLDVVGHETEQQMLQHRTGTRAANGASGAVNFHGHGLGSESEKKEEYAHYFRAIDQIITSELKDQSRRLILACVSYLYPIYKGVNNYENLSDSFIHGNHDDAKPHQLVEEMSAAMQTERIEDEKENFEQALSALLASYDFREIVPAAIEGRVDTLLVAQNEELWGRYDRQKNTVEVEQVHSVHNASLLNVAAIHTLRNGGKVRVHEKSELPAAEVPMNAYFRFVHQSAGA